MTTEKTPAERAKIIDKIKKCLALSKSASEHEAAAALRQAQKMMKLYQIDEMEVEGEIIVNAFVDTREKFSVLKPDSITSITRLMSAAFGVMVMFSRSPSGRHRITYWGNYAAVTIAIHAHKMVYRAADEGWEKYKSTFYKAEESVPKKVKPSYVLGWCEMVAQKVEDLAPRGDAWDRMKKAVETKSGGAPIPEIGKKKKELEIDSHAAHHGVEAGKKFNLHIPLTSNE